MLSIFHSCQLQVFRQPFCKLASYVGRLLVNSKLSFHSFTVTTCRKEPSRVEEYISKLYIKVLRHFHMVEVQVFMGGIAHLTNADMTCCENVSFLTSTART